MKTETTLDISLVEPYTKNLSKAQLWKETVGIWDMLEELKYNPADLGCGTITMRPNWFKKLVNDHGGQAAIKETRNYKVSAVWIGHIEVSLLELKTDDDSWTISEDWDLLESYYV